MSDAQAPAQISRREQILREAARLFAERGFHGVGVDEIGAAVGISGPGLYRHFAGKDAMLAELLVGISERLLAGGRMRIAEGGESPEAVLRALIDGHIDFALDDRPLITLHDRELDRLREADRKRVRQLQRQYVELWVDVVREVHPGPSESRARAAVHAVFGLLNSTPHLGRPGALPGRTEMAELLHGLALGAFGAVAREAAEDESMAASVSATASAAASGA
ncbi:TetR/AcrR family transcriptional regulator [Streptomyces kronopolitis]|uniref:SACE_7040 family transcriptional regulator n=1 Tax=Streptomyces TaxID=1883 RepID=UPI00255263D5|nr:TetR/AcrR family transcriptional regulator [Streptomyces sp. NBRC 13847]